MGIGRQGSSLSHDLAVARRVIRAEIDGLQLLATALNGSLGATHALHINGEDRASASHDTRRSPIDQRRVLGHFPLATVDDANQAMAAAQTAFPSWRATP